MPEIECLDVLDGRHGFRMEAPWGRVSMLAQGGHICEISSRQHGGLNPLWRPPWKTIDPASYQPGRHARLYGPPPDGPLLSGLAGHSLSLDYFGPPSAEETRAGLSTHGEAPVTEWTLANAEPTAIECVASLAEARIRVRRKLSIDPNHPTVYCEETAENQTPFDRPICWAQHVTLGPPFLEPGVTRLDMPGTHSRTYPAGYSKKSPVRPDSDFEWPFAPAKEGRKKIDLRTMPPARYGHYTAQLLDTDLKHGWVAASNPRSGLLIVYVFERATYPWVGNWEQRLSWDHAPWKERTFCRGMEFSTTPFAVPRRESIEQHRLFDVPTYTWLAARSRMSIRYVAALFAVRSDFSGVGRVTLGRGRLNVFEQKAAGTTLQRTIQTWL